MPRDPLIRQQCPHCGPEGHDFSRKRCAVSPEERRGNSARFAQDVVHTAPSWRRPWPPRGWQAALLEQCT
eukprot:11467816-Heterocapsa_arctica.AAC.1